jgi:hypothetical protein
MVATIGRPVTAAPDPGACHVQLRHTVLRAVQRHPVAVAAEGVGQDDVGPGLGHAAVKRRDPVRMIDIPQLRRIAGHQPCLEQVGARGAVGHEIFPLGQQGVQKVAHAGVRCPWAGPWLILQQAQYTRGL